MTTPRPTSPTTVTPATLGRGAMLLTYVSASYGFGMHQMINFLLPLRAYDLGASLEVIGLMVGAGALVPALLSVVAGALADRIGPRGAYIVGTGVTGLLGVLFAFTTSYWLVGALQLVFGFFRSMGWVAAQTYISGVGAPAQRATIMGRFSFAANAGPLVTPLLAGFVLEQYGFTAAFLTLAATALAFALVGWLLPDVRSTPVGGKAAAGGGLRATRDLLVLPGVQIALLLTCVRLWLSSGWGPFFQLYLQEHGFSPTVMSSVISANYLVSTVVTLGASRLTRFASKEVITALALALGALGMAVSPHVVALPFVYLPALLLGTASGLSLPLLMAIMGDNAPPERRGLAMGLRTSANQAASAASPITTGALIPALGTPLGFAVVAAFLWLLIGLTLGVYARGRSRPIPSPFPAREGA